MSSALCATDLGKRYGRKWALRSCTLDIPTGHVVGLVGPNGAGKTTLLHLAVGLLTPSSGSLMVLDEAPASSAEQLGRIGFVAQDTPVFESLSIATHLHMGAALNLNWDAQMAKQRIHDLGLDPSQRAGRPSGGQRAQLALTLAIAKRPSLLFVGRTGGESGPLGPT
jgi:ABC-2 type transport system ATP-binding protein